MNKILAATMAAMTVLVISGNAAAETWYVSVAGGASMAADHDFDTGAGAVGKVDTETDTGFASKVAVGVALEEMRLEFEVGMRSGSVDSHEVGGTKLPGSEGDIAAASYMFNVLYDLDDALDLEHITPYVGAGIGAGAVKFDGYTVAGVPSVLDDEDAGFAYQFIAGVSYPISESLDITVDYQYLSILDLEVDTDLGDNNSDVDYDSHALFAGIRYSF